MDWPSDQISRRSFFYFLIAGLVMFVVWTFRRIDSASALQEYFGFNQDYRPVIEKRFVFLRKQNAVLYRDSILFFGFSAFRGEKWLHKKLRSRVLSNWVFFLFRNREIAWPYVNYPSVGKFQICNGLIRNNS